MNSKSNKEIINDVQLYSDRSYNRYKIIVLAVSILFLMLRFGAIVPDADRLFIKGFKILNLSKTIAALYLVWLFLYLDFYQKYGRYSFRGAGGGFRPLVTN